VSPWRPRAGQHACRAVQGPPVGELEPHAAPGHEPLQLGRGATCDDAAAIEQGDPGREPVRLLQVLRRQEDRDAPGDQVADDVPHHPPASRIETRRGLVEEDDPRLSDERHREVEAPAHSARPGHRRSAGHVDQVEPLEELRHAPPATVAPEVMEVGHQPQVLSQ